MSYHDWHVGMQVVCVDPTWGTAGRIQRYCCPILPEKNAIYTLRSIECRVVVIGRAPEILIRLTEIVNPVINGSEAVFFASKFRPIQKRATDIAIFTAMLNKTKVPA